MNTSPFFHHLRAAYLSELDDLRTDTEGHDVLHKRLAAKRRELSFLVKVMADDPEMVAVVLHRAFRFANPDRMDQLVAHDADELPTWHSISDTIEIASWAQEIVQTILKEPVGEWFMAVSASLEYMYHKPLTAQERVMVESQLDDDEEGKQDRDAVRVERHEDSHTEDHDEEESSARAREVAANDWLVEQGFDRKD